MDKKIIVKLKGGLGNQMFQYALAYRLANNKENIFFDLSLLRPPKKGEDYIYREYSLDIFGIKPTKAPNKLLSKFNRTTLFKSRKLRTLYNKLLGYSYIEEKNLFYDHDVTKKARRITYLNGYWQSEKYFLDIKDKIKDLYKINIDWQEYNLHISKKLKQTNSVAIFVRRQEYAYHAKTRETLKALPIEYYKKAVEIIYRFIPKPTFFIFSDDLKWCKENFSWLTEKTFVEHVDTGIKYEKYLMLLKTSKHHIIANSTYSWWGAWLSNYEKKIVIAPQKWFTEKINEQSRDIIPKTWIKI